MDTIDFIITSDGNAQAIQPDPDSTTLSEPVQQVYSRDLRYWQQQQTDLAAARRHVEALVEAGGLLDGTCLYCGAFAALGHDVNHYPDCEWAAARCWLAASGEGAGEKSSPSE